MRRVPYLRKMLSVAEIVAIAETGWEASSEEDISRAAEWDPTLRATLVYGGQYRRNSGMAIAIAHAAPVTQVEKRLHPDEELQLLVVDMSIRGAKVRMVVNHGDPSSDPNAKVQHYIDVQKALIHIAKEDIQRGSYPEGMKVTDYGGGSSGRLVLWAGDQNMVEFPEVDEAEDKGNLAGDALKRVVSAMRGVRHSLGDTRDMVRHVAADKKRVYTHQGRRLDRMEGTASMLDSAAPSPKSPKITEASHIELNDLKYEYMLPRLGMQVACAHHKAVRVTLQFTQDMVAQPTWKYRARGYSPEVWRRMLQEIEEAYAEPVETELRVSEDGEVTMKAKIRSEEEQFEDMKTRISKTLQAAEKAERGLEHKQIAQVEGAQAQWAKKAGRQRKGSNAEREARAQAARLGRKAAGLRKRRALREYERDRCKKWSYGSQGVKELYAWVDKKGVTGPMEGLRYPGTDKGGELQQTREGMLDVCKVRWEELFNRHKQVDEAATEAQKAEREASVERLRDTIRWHMASLEGRGERVMAGLTVETMFSEENVGPAVTEMTKGTEPGQGGLPPEYYNLEGVKEKVVPRLCRLFREVFGNRDMTESMKVAIITVLFKGKGKDEQDVGSYRPISVTPTEYRIMTKAIQRQLHKVVRQIIGTTQVGCLGGDRQVYDNTMLLVEGLHRMNSETGGGVVVQVDNSSAFDLVRWDYAHLVLEEMGFPLEFREMIKVLYHDIRFRLKVNGGLGPECGVSNGVRQGCGVSPLIFVLVQETLLMSIRRDTELHGARLGKRSAAETKERCVVDDTVVYLRDVDQLPRLFELMGDYERASGQMLCEEKSSVILAGHQKARKAELGEKIKKKVCFGDEGVEVDKGLGVVVGTEAQVRVQWTSMLDRISEECLRDMTALKKDLSVPARTALVAGAYASKTLYTTQTQVPKNANAILAEAQRKLDMAVFGRNQEVGEWGRYYMTKELSYQPGLDGGLGHIHLQSKMEAEWGALALSMVARKAAWHELWGEVLDGVYPGLQELTPGGLAGTTCAFHLLQECEEATEVQRRAFAVLGRLQAPSGRWEQKRKESEEEGSEQETGAAGKKGGAGKEEGPTHEWRKAMVHAQPLFFNVWYTKGTMLTGRSTKEVEGHACAWAARGLRTWGDLILPSGAVVSAPIFRMAHPGLSMEVYAAMRREFLEEWKEGMAQTDEAPGELEAVCRVWTKRTLVNGGNTRIEKMRVGDVYRRLLAEMWQVPKQFQDGQEGDRVWKEGHRERPEEARREDMAAVYKGIRHPAVPKYLQEKVYQVATGTGLVGARYGHHAYQGVCPRCGDTDSHEHAFGGCKEVQKAFACFANMWHKATGEKVSAHDRWFTLWGYRRTRWWCEEQEAEFGSEGTEEVFRVLHAAIVVAVHDSRHSMRKLKGHMIYQQAQGVALRMIQDRRAHVSKAKFDAIWVIPGYVREVGKGSGLRLCVYESGFKRAVCTPQPEQEAPVGVMELYTDGGAAEGVAGWGFVAVQNGVAVHEACGPVAIDESDPGWTGADRATNNTGEVTAVIAALRWV